MTPWVAQLFFAMQALFDAIERLTAKVGRLAAYLSVLLVLVVCFDVLMRYFFNHTRIWMVELEWHLFAALFLLSGAWTLQRDRHVRVDVFYNRLKPRDKALVNLYGSLLFLLPWAFIVLIVSWNNAWQSFLLREASPDPGGLPARYLVKALVPLAFFLLILQALAELHKAYRTLKEKA